ncbi:uncharacterized protein PV07_09686 [Cladophialophora immunda]|uniref:Major facilitator superfamily (MFS) profile domain-containing protein n=1 Tax=Cladophialophora immunda TaxID=569365 RepID=A0A0D2CK69_9EURO|nr:uncharacterized protein PV07_09686 [Cladophialophora immunda]KIW23939.1 hypothetical protein PV07_09686 [Cladophialophora immunda]
MDKISIDHQIRGTNLLRHMETNEIVLIPAPSDDPRDPLHWPQWFKAYIAILVCFAQFFGNFVLGGPSIAIVLQAEQFGDHIPKHLAHWIGQASYFITVSSLLAGLANIFWVPIMTKYGRRPVYVFSLVLVCASSVWCGCAKAYGVELAGRAILGFALGAVECVAPCTLADIFFLHERGFWISIYFAAVSMGISAGVALSGLITIGLPWPYIYWIFLAFNGFITILVACTFPETFFHRSAPSSSATQIVAIEAVSDGAKQITPAIDNPEITETAAPSQKVSPLSDLRIFHGPRTSESLFKIFCRPLLLVVIPSVLWYIAVMAVNIGGLIILTTTAPAAFPEYYSFVTWQAGLTFLAAVIGGFLGVAGGGYFQDKFADYLTRRNRGIREAEFILPAMVIPTVTGVLALVLYGAGIQQRWHWIIPTIGIGLQSFALVCCSGISMVYCIESYRPIAGEIVVCGLSYKACLAFLLSFYVNPWLAKDGYQTTMGIIAALLGFVQSLALVFYFCGKTLRKATENWRVLRFIAWPADREVGE